MRLDLGEFFRLNVSDDPVASCVFWGFKHKLLRKQFLEMVEESEREKNLFHLFFEKLNPAIIQCWA